VNWQIFTVCEVNINYELSHKLNDVVNVKMNSHHEVEIEVSIPHTYMHTNIVHNEVVRYGWHCCHHRWSLTNKTNGGKNIVCGITYCNNNSRYNIPPYCDTCSHKPQRAIRHTASSTASWYTSVIWGNGKDERYEIYAEFNHIIETCTRGKNREIHFWASQRDSARLSRTGRAYSLKP
jgi:hypothetical protein